MSNTTDCLVGVVTICVNIERYHFYFYCMFNIITVEQNFRDFSGFAFWLYLTNWQKQCWWIYSNTISILLVIGKTDGKESFRNLYSTSTKVGVFIKRTLHTPSDPPQKLNISSTTKTRRTTTTIKKKNNIINNNNNNNNKYISAITVRFRKNFEK